MNMEKVIFAFFIVLALTLNFGFFIGDIGNPDHHHALELGAALVVSLIATVVKFGDKCIPAESVKGHNHASDNHQNPSSTMLFSFRIVQQYEHKS